MSEEYQEIPAEEARAYMARGREEDYLLVDVRQPDEYAREHIPGAVLIPLGELPDRLDELPVDRDIIFYCRSGMRSRGAAISASSRPRTSGITFNLTGGMLAWNGQVLEETPNLKTYDLDAPEQDLLLRAMDLECGAERFYTALRERYNAVPWAAGLATLARAEEMHARMIYRFWAEGETAPPPFETVYAGLAGELVEGGRSVAELLANLERQPLTPCRAVLEIALAIEYAGYDLSRVMAHRFQGQLLGEVFTSIAEAEKEHMRIVASKLGQCEG
ncbi:MAG: rhodanese-like domain-containing protein [Desulfobulbus sp.]|jgi:rhodanese-related sulfurtransferase/rubrerythrin|nr:rhodanese-like domain-containing protein [Desulfobulbus sp.]